MGGGAYSVCDCGAVWGAYPGVLLRCSEKSVAQGNVFALFCNVCVVMVVSLVVRLITVMVGDEA